MTRLSQLLVLGMFASVTLDASSREIYLDCSVAGSDGKRYQYSFAFDPERGTLFWVEGAQQFKVFRNTSTQLWASHEAKFRDFPHDMTDFRLNRVTGAAEVNYLRKPSREQVASCKKGRNWGCEDFLVLTEKSENGSCRVTERAIK